jgi:hypothetical protein
MGLLGDRNEADGSCLLGDDEGGAGAAVFITAVGRCVAEAGPPGAGACAPTRKPVAEPPLGRARAAALGPSK